jgi:hypothetical protein
MSDLEHIIKAVVYFSRYKGERIQHHPTFVQKKCSIEKIQMHHAENQILMRKLITGAPRQLVKSGQALLSYLDSLKKEYRALRKLWLTLHEHFSDCDELRQAAKRIRFMTPIEIMMNFDEVPFTVHPFMVSVT